MIAIPVRQHTQELEEIRLRRPRKRWTLSTLVSVIVGLITIAGVIGSGAVAIYFARQVPAIQDRLAAQATSQAMLTERVNGLNKSVDEVKGGVGRIENLLLNWQGGAAPQRRSGN